MQFPYTNKKSIVKTFLSSTYWEGTEKLPFAASSDAAEGSFFAFRPVGINGRKQEGRSHAEH
jgi:hypothetical protein